MDDLDRWANLEGPPPAWLEEALDTLAPPLSPEEEDAMDRKVYAAIAADRRRREALRRRATWAAAAVLGATATAAILGGGMLLARRAKGRAPPRTAVGEMAAGAVIEAPRDGGASGAR